MEKISSIEDVSPIIKKDFLELYTLLSNKLGEINPFAKFSIGHGFYQWSDVRCDWVQMIAASEFEQQMIRDAIKQLKLKISKIFGEPTTDKLFTTPDDSYIYYCKDGGEYQILITGWGFKKPTRRRPKPDVVIVDKTNPVTLSFCYDGKRLTDYEIIINLPDTKRLIKTDENGLLSFPNVNVNESLEFISLSGEEKYSVLIVPEQSHYDIDVTDFADLLVKVNTYEPISSGDEVTINYYNKTYTIKLNDAGVASVKLPFYKSESASATFKDVSASTIIENGSNIITIDIEPPVYETDIEVSVMQDGVPLPSYLININYAGKSYDGETNENGLFIQRVAVVEKENCIVSAPYFDQQIKQLEKIEVNKFIFEKEPEPPKRNIKLIFHDYNGKPMPNAEVCLKQAGYPDLMLTLNENGETYINEDVFDIHKDITTSIKNGDVSYEEIKFSVVAEENEYLFEEKKSKTSWLLILLSIFIVILIAFALYNVWPYFEDFCADAFNEIYNQ